MNKINLIQGDCLEEMKNIESGSVDLILTDPPYGTTACKWDNVIPFAPMWEQLKRIIKLNGAIVLFGSEPFSSLLRCSNLKMFKYDWVWEKAVATNFLNANRQPLRNYEAVSVFYKKQPNYSPQKIKGKPYKCKQGISSESVSADKNVTSGGHVTVNNGDRHPKQILKFDNEKGLHPTQKPVPLMEYLIKTYTNQGETVLDFTMGSGSTGVAAKNLGRDFIGIELDKGYFEIARKRIEEA